MDCELQGTITSVRTSGPNGWALEYSSGGATSTIQLEERPTGIDVGDKITVSIKIEKSG